MALIKPIHGEMKGSIAGNTFQAGRFGQVVRQKRIPVNPATEAQGTSRVHLANTNILWKVLSQALKNDWDEYAQNTPWKNAFGDETMLTGRQMQIRVNTFRLDAGQPVIQGPPVTPGLGTNPDFTLLGTTVGGIQVDDFDIGGGLLDIQRYSLAGPFANSKQKHKGPWRSTVYINSDEVAPFELLPPADVQITQVYFALCHTMDPDGRLSAQSIIKRVEVFA